MEWSIDGGDINPLILHIRPQIKACTLLCTLTISMFALTMFAFDQSSQTAFAQNKTSPLAGMNFSKPVDVWSKDGVLNTTIVAEYKIGKVDNQTTTAMVYNGSLLGPTFHVYPGDRVEIDLVNNLNESTNLHYHGLHVSPANVSDNVLLDVPPGATQHYVLDIPKDHDPGTLWYHSHLHKLSYAQVASGLSGMFIVEGLEKLLPESLQNVTQHTFAMKDFPFDQLFAKTYKLSNTMTMHERLTVNGDVNPTINIKPGETQLWRLANIGPENELTVQLPGNMFYIIAEDGSPVWSVWKNDTLFMSSGKRYDVLVTANGSGPVELVSANNMFTAPYDRHIATINIQQGNQTNGTSASDILGTALIPNRDLSNATVAEHRVLNFSSNDRDWKYYINNKTFDPNRVDITAKLGTVEEWKLVNLDNNSTMYLHPFHIHVNDFQVMSINGKPYDAHGRQDTVDLPIESEVVIRIPFDDFVGKTVYHCHLMFHGDFGMMGLLNIVK